MFFFRFFFALFEFEVELEFLLSDFSLFLNFKLFFFYIQLELIHSFLLLKLFLFHSFRQFMLELKKIELGRFKLSHVCLSFLGLNQERI